MRGKIPPALLPWSSRGSTYDNISFYSNCHQFQTKFMEIIQVNYRTNTETELTLHAVSKVVHLQLMDMINDIRKANKVVSTVYSAMDPFMKQDISLEEKLYIEALTKTLFLVFGELCQDPSTRRKRVFSAKAILKDVLQQGQSGYIEHRWFLLSFELQHRD
ncbi:hypothetical protein DINM_005751 [Dirofilaria immitis]|nr:hypothetical protein [Dirofilaria immitis]